MSTEDLPALMQKATQKAEKLKQEILYFNSKPEPTKKPVCGYGEFEKENVDYCIAIFNYLIIGISCALSLMASTAITKEWFGPVGDDPLAEEIRAAEEDRGHFIIVLSSINIIMRFCHSIFVLFQCKFKAQQEDIFEYALAMAKMTISEAEHKDEFEAQNKFKENEAFWEKKEEEASWKTNNDYSILFNTISTLSDGAFNILQGIFLLKGFQYEFKVKQMVNIATRFGAGTQGFQLFGVLWSVFATKGFGAKKLCWADFYRGFLLFVLVMILVQHSLGIYIATQNIDKEEYQELFKIALTISAVMIVVSIVFGVLAVCDWCHCCDKPRRELRKLRKK